jgi:hypothetical protein
MSMSQEEIEALMNGLDIEDDVEAEDETVAVNTQEIEELLSQTEGLKEDIKFDNEKIEENEVEFKPSTTSVSSSDIEKLLSEIENASENTSSPIEEVMIEPEKFDEPEKVIVATEKKLDKKPDRSEDEIVNDWTNTKIKEGIFPFPAEKDTKVVNQLSQVANDSEEKVSQIFDVLSLTLDNNNELRNYVKDFEVYFSTQSSLLSTLNSKFPNIKVFNEHLSNTNKVAESLKSIKNLINSEDSEIFQAMELMQFNDINRQKIERVMSVIRKLSLYLNNLFEDDGATKDVAIAKHIHGDSTDDLIGDDLDKLIAEFSHDK